MGEIDDARHAEDDRQARRDKKQRRSTGKAGQKLNEVKGHIRSALAQFSGFILRDGAEFIIGRAFARPVGASSG